MPAGRQGPPSCKGVRPSRGPTSRTSSRGDRRYSLKRRGVSGCDTPETENWQFNYPEIG